MFKIGDKVIYKKLDKRHHFNTEERLDKLTLNKVYTIHSLYNSKVTNTYVMTLREKRTWNYDINCFELYKPKKLRIKLP